MNLVISLIKEVLTIVFKMVVTHAAQEAIKRIKGRIAPTDDRSDSDMK